MALRGGSILSAVWYDASWWPSCPHHKFTMAPLELHWTRIINVLCCYYELIVDTVNQRCDIVALGCLYELENMIIWVYKDSMNKQARSTKKQPSSHWSQSPPPYWTMQSPQSLPQPWTSSPMLQAVLPWPIPTSFLLCYPASHYCFHRLCRWIYSCIQSRVNILSRVYKSTYPLHHWSRLLSSLLDMSNLCWRSSW